jgi:3'(2'), 5'-bisphosphate nucleotidase
MNLDNELLTAIQAAEEASKIILEVYGTDDFQQEAKGDNSPLTIADRKAHAVISVILEATNLPVLSEEGKDIPYEERKSWEYFWMVDPLDGTKEFIKRNGEFTVNIALIHNGVPILGVVAVPVTGEIFYALQGKGAHVKRGGKTEMLSKRKTWDQNQKGLRVVASRSHMNDETQQFINDLDEPTLVSKGSSLKFMLLAEGKADIYPRYAPTMEWDTAAAHAIVNETGLKVLEYGTDREIRYNKENLLNPFFLVK